MPLADFAQSTRLSAFRRIADKFFAFQKSRLMAWARLKRWLAGSGFERSTPALRQKMKHTLVILLMLAATPASAADMTLCHQALAAATCRSTLTTSTKAL